MHDAQQADAELRGDHVDDRRHAREPVAPADRREQVPPVQPAGDGEADVLERVDAAVLERGVVERRDVPGRHRRHVEQRGEDRVRERAGRALQRLHAPGGRPQDHAREPEDAEDRRDVEQQQVLRHVHRQHLLADAVDRRDERDAPASSAPAKHTARHVGASRERATVTAW